jgi:hypothetical protein
VNLKKSLKRKKRISKNKGVFAPFFLDMESFLDYKKVFDIDIVSLLDESVKKTKDKAVYFNKEQLQDGEDALAQTIKTLSGHPYTPYTMKIRKSLGLQIDKVDLKVTGDFYNTFKLVILKDGYKITANFKKEDGDIRDNFSNSYDFLGLTDESLNEWVDNYVFPLFVKSIKKQIGL